MPRPLLQDDDGLAAGVPDLDETKLWSTFFMRRRSACSRVIEVEWPLLR